MDLHNRLLTVLTEHDKRESKKRGYNPAALGIYFRALAEAEENQDIKTGLQEVFCEPLLSKLLKAI